jgi:hypothetical protein
MTLPALFMTSTRLNLCDRERKKFIRDIAFRWCSLALRKSKTIVRDCLPAALKLFSMVFLLLPLGLLISHFVPLTSISAILRDAGRKNTTSV